MNESGRAVGPLMTYFGIYPEELVVIYDDLDRQWEKSGSVKRKCRRA